MFGRKEIVRLRAALLTEQEARGRERRRADDCEGKLKKALEELEVFKGKQAVIDQFYNLLTFDGHPQMGHPQMGLSQPEDGRGTA